MSERIEVSRGKYVVLIADDGTVSALRYGAPWRDLTGDKLVYSLATELQQARNDAANAIAILNPRAG